MIKRFVSEKSRLAVVFVILIAAFAVVAMRSRANFNEGISSLGQNETLKAITLLERSALLYAPMNPYWRKSAAELEKIANKPEVYKPEFSRQAGSAIGRIKGQLNPWGQSAWNHSGLNHPANAVMPLWYRLGVHITFMGWLACSVALFFKGFGSEGGIKGKPASVYLAVSLTFLAAWLYLLGQ